MAPDFSLRDNAFRILGLDTRALPSAVVERADELRVLLSVNQTRIYPGDFPVFEAPERTHEAITAASHRLEDPESRLIDEAAWFDIQDPIDMAASSALGAGQPDQAKMIWDEAAHQSPDRAVSLRYQHNSAVLSLGIAEIPSGPKVSTLVVWVKALVNWVPMLDDSAYWIDLVSRSLAGQDARCPSDAPRRVRAVVGHTLAARFRQRAIEALRANRVDDARAWVAALPANRFPREFLEPAFADVLNSLADLIRAELAPIQMALREGNEEQADLKLVESTLLRVRTSLENFKQLASQENSALEGAADLLAGEYGTLAMHYANRADGLARSLELLATGKSVAGTESLRVQLSQDARPVRWLIAAAEFGEAQRKGDHAAAQRAFDVLEQNCNADENYEVLESFREALRGLRATRGCAPILKAPTLHTINGIGTKLYGRGDWDPETETYITTQFLTILFMPMIALGRYRVEALRDGRIRFYGKAPLTRKQRTWNTVVALAVLVVIAGAVIDGQGTTTSVPLPVSVEEPTNPASTATPDQHSAMGEEIQRRRLEVQAAQFALEQESRAIDVEQASLTALRLQIQKRRSQYPDGLPPEEYATDEREVAQYNKRARALRGRIDSYNVRLEQVKRDIAEFDALVERYNNGR